jgi:plastocyanin domain-containing protein
MSNKGADQKGMLILVGFAVFFVILTIIFIKFSTNNSGDLSQNTTSAVSDSNGIQYVDVTAKGGYTPSNISAKANTKTILRMKTSSTFDCSSALVIPSINYRNNLPPTAVTEIEIPSQKPGTTLRGACAMGMYRFSINFN